MKVLRSPIIFIVVVILTVLLAFGLNQIGLKDENVYLIFVLAIIVINIETRTIYYSLLSSFVFILFFNYFLTEPYYTFVINDTNHYISFAIFIFVSVIVNSLVAKLQREIIKTTKNEKMIKILYHFSNKFLSARTKQEIYQIFLNYMSEYIDVDFTIYDHLGEGFVIGKEQPELYKDQIEYCLERDIVVGLNEYKFPQLPIKIFPIKSTLKKYGVLMISPGKHTISSEESNYIRTVISELIVALDRDLIINEQEHTKVQVEKEKFKSALLRGLSHDLKTPLTLLQGGSEFLLDNYSSIDEESRKKLIGDIYQESIQLNDFITNLLNLSKMDNNKNLLNRKIESLTEILISVRSKVKKIAFDKQIEFENLENDILIYTDAMLLSQVIFNLVDNAIKHTHDKAKVLVRHTTVETNLIVQVIDNGGGIPLHLIDTIFDDFYSITANLDRKRSTGLGLSICKAIITAHGGEIKGYNNDIGGATFEFTIPSVKKTISDV